MSEHAFLPPSSADKWVVCAMWPTMNERFPEIEPQEESLEGQTAHWILKATLVDGASVELGALCPETGKTVDEEMLEGTEIFFQTLERYVPQDQTVQVEERISGKRVHDTLNWGTPDAWSVTDTVPGVPMTLDVFDYKHGHEYVEVYENWQLINYTALIFEKLGIGGANDHLVTVRLHVIQPRSYTPAGPVRTWELRGDDLRAYFNILQTAATKATSPEPVATVGPQCKHCPGRHACVALQRAAQGAADLSLHSLPVELPPAAVGLELHLLHRAQKLLEARIAGLEEQAMALIRRGELVPWYRMGTVQGRENWGKPVEEVIALGQLLGVDVAKPGVITPTQARKKGLAPAVVEAYLAPRGNVLRLEPDDNTLARKVFG